MSSQCPNMVRPTIYRIVRYTTQNGYSIRVKDSVLGLHSVGPCAYNGGIARKEVVTMAGSKMSKEDLQVWLTVNKAATKKSRNKKRYTRKGKSGKAWD